MDEEPIEAEDFSRQKEIQAKCFHASGEWRECKPEDALQSIANRFEEIVALYPQRVAIKMGQRSLTYSQVNESANRLAHCLLATNHDSSLPVGILLEHGVSPIIAILGVLKAGKIFLVLDLAYPNLKISHILADAGNELLITNQKNLARAREFASPTTPILDIHQDVEGFPDTNPGVVISAGDIGYLVYTSGSTGSPKGISSPHKMLLTNIMGHINALHVCAEDRIANLHSCAFASSFTEIFCALLTGAALYPWDFAIDGFTGLQEMLDGEAITILNWGPTPFRHFTSLLTPNALSSLRVLMLGNEPLLHTDIDLYKRYCPDNTVLIHRFGSSESGNIARLYIDKSTEIESKTVPAGYMIPGQEVLLLDDSGNAVEAGQVGEIVVRNRHCMAYGYWRQPEPQERFLSTPGSDIRTFLLGDIGLMRPDGCLFVLGRKDFQVKIRGHRIEIGEIENALSAYQGVQDSAVVVVTDDIGDAQLVAYLVAEPYKDIDINTLRDYLQEHLSRNMIPAKFHLIEKMPVTDTGKMDRRALQNWETAKPLPPTTSHQPPETPLQQFLYAHWQKILGAIDFGIHDSFFALGGDSIKAAILSNRIQQKFGEVVKLSTLFERPTVAKLALYITEHALETVESALQDEPQSPAMEPLPSSLALPTSTLPDRLSFAQERLWFLQKLAPDSGAYNLGSAWRLTGALNREALLRSLNEIVRRHSILRAFFVWQFDRVAQIINPLEDFRISQSDFCNLSEEAARTRLQDLLKTELQRPYRLSREFPLRLHLVRLTPSEHILVAASHHIVWDAWSQNLFQQELSRLYEAFTTGAASPLEELPIQYSNYALWQREQVQGALFETQRTYWQKQLEDAGTLQLPTDRPAPLTQSYSGDVYHFRLSQELTSALKNFSTEQDATLFMTLLAAFNVLLYRYSGQSDFTVGIPVASRSQAELESLIGCFLNILALRTDVAPETSFQTLLANTKRVTLDALSNQDVPFEKLVELLHLERNPTKTPLIQTLFQLQNTPRHPLALPQIETVRLPSEPEATHYELSVTLREEAGAITGRIDYSNTLFFPETIARMARHFENLLHAVVSNPDTAVGSLPMLSEAESEQILVDWNRTQVDWTEDDYTALFEQQVERTPNAVAVVFEKESLTYRQLNRRANQLARQLQEAGVSPDVPVGLCVERSLDMLIGFLGILKAGGACVPLNPEYPTERLDYILDDVQAPVLITQSRLDAHLPETTAQVLCIDRDAPRIAKQSGDNFISGALPSHLAYIIYTSGSTGYPKGVLVERRGMQNHIQSKIMDLGLTEDDRVVQSASQSFDIAVWQLLTALLVGGTTHIVTQDTASTPVSLITYCTDNSITILEVVPSFLSVLLGADLPLGKEPKPFTTLRWLVSTGEALPPTLCREWFAQYPNTPLINAYGPTECSDRIAHYPLYAPPGSSVLHLPIGRPLANTQLYILDTALQPVPIGVTGELYIGGTGVGRGYLDHPEETRKRFIANPFGSGRLFKTGDAVRYLPDGNVEFLGRNDRQVKLRGFRIELGEIESVLEQHPAIHRSVAVVLQRDADEKRLIAYIVLHKNSHAAMGDIEPWLRGKLPHYMVPSAFVFIDDIPRTSRGKLDYAALPPPELSLSMRKKTAPRDALEIQFTRIWEQILGVKPIGIDDDFFEFGGHSLLAVRLFDQIQRVTGKRLPVATLFQHPTIAQLAELIRQENWLPPWKSIAPIQPGGSKPPVYLVPPMASTSLKIEGITRYLPKNQPVYALEYLGLKEDESPHSSVEEMANYYVEQICTLQPEGPYLIGGFCFGCMVALEIAQQLHRQGKEVALLALVGASRPDRGPTWQPPKRFSREHWMVLQEYWKELGFGVWFRKYAIRTFHKLIRPLEQRPKVLDNTFEAHTKAQVQYQAQQYTGRLLLIQTEDFVKSYISEKWNEIGVGVSEFIVIEGVSHREALYKEPYTRQIAEQLTKKIDEIVEKNA